MKTTTKTTAKSDNKSGVKESKSIIVDKKTGEIKIESINKLLHAKISNIETAYIAAISGKMKFSKVKEMFKKLHREVKSSTKK
jgi:hypothetical protein